MLENTEYILLDYFENKLIQTGYKWLKVVLQFFLYIFHTFTAKICLLASTLEF
jgi:hypothetical protein